MTPPTEPSESRTALEALCTLDIQTAELKGATLGLLLAGKRFLTAISKGAVVSVEVGGETPLRVHVRDKPNDEPTEAA